MHARRNTTFTNAETPGGWRAVGATPSLLPASRPGSTRRRRAGRPRGFTLTEILIVIGLIVLVIALAVPAFNAMTGGRSIDAATNQLSAMFGRARMEAIGLQEPRGLLFYRDPASQRIAARLVRVAGSSVAGIQGLDLVEDREPMFLPVGIGLQMVDDAVVTGTGPAAVSADDRYVGYNKSIGRFSFKTKPAQLYVGGVILFDQAGRQSSKLYGFRAGEIPVAGSPGKPVLTAMGQFLLGETAQVPASGSDAVMKDTSNPGSHRSNFGFVLYDDETFKARGFTDEDPQVSGGGRITQPEKDEEKWLDENALPVLVNRYNGTLIRGE
jgi:prepilin-type N-terminal cleavage/methylation domain-containing protein